MGKYSPGSVRLTDGQLTDYFIGESFTASMPITPAKQKGPFKFI